MMISELLKESLPTYEVYLPVCKKNHKFRPMTVKEEKILLLAQQSGSAKEMGNSLVQIIKNCFHDIPYPEQLAIGDAEKALLAIRSKSIGEEATFFIRCPETQESVMIRVNMEEFSLNVGSSESTKIKLSEEMLLFMKHPTLKYLCENEEEDEQKRQFRVCFLELQTKDNTIKKEELSDSDLNEFYDNMTAVQLAKFTEYIDAIPRMKKQILYKTKDGTQRNMELYGIDSFFAFASAT
jgi:hypothetical protein